MGEGRWRSRGGGVVEVKVGGEGLCIFGVWVRNALDGLGMLSSCG